ncbi:CHAT domain-containing protein [Nevskia sp.]|uniref:CHAT domain-containing protein n=1 Tax=Nevskia sp. TaxID=1929292 RepID=UPI0025D20B09|nr:CHAT domain-containing protein [Nevskia sp.]
MRAAACALLLGLSLPIAASEPLPLAPGDILSEALAGGESRDYRVALAAGQAAQLRLEQTGLRALDLVWTTPATLAPIRPAAGRGAAREQMLVASTSAAVWTFRIAARGKGQPVAYRLALAAAHPQREVDVRRAAADQALARADLLRLAAGSSESATRGGEASLRAATAAYRDAIARWQALGDGCGERRSAAGLARLQFARSDYPAAAASARRAIAAGCARDAAADLAEAERTLGAALAYQSDLVAAIAAQERALALYRQTGDQRFEGVVLGNLSANYAETGQSARALAAARAALTAAQATDDREGLLFSQDRIAALNAQRGNFDEAREGWQSLLAALAATPYPRAENMAWNGLGALHRTLGEADAAQAAAAKAEAAARAAEDVAAIAEALRFRGELALDEARWSEATARYGEALTLANDAGLARDAALALGGLARAALAAGDLPAARRQIERALAIAAQKQATAARLLLEPIAGDIASRAGRPAAAAGHYRAALQLARAVPSPTRIAPALASLARLAAEAGRLDEALAGIDDAIAHIDSLRSGLADPATRSSYFASNRAYHGFRVDLLMQMDARRPGRGYAARALLAAERARARALVEQLARQRLPADPRRQPLLAERDAAEDRLRLLDFRLARLSAGPSPQRKRLATERGQAAAALDAARNRLRAAEPQAAELRDPQPLTLPELRRDALAADVSLLEYWFGDARSHLWILSRDRLVAVELPPRAGLEARIAALRDKLARPPRAAVGEDLAALAARQTREQTAIAEDAAALAAILLPPAADNGAALRLVVADGALQHLPFAILDGNPAVDHVYLPSLQTLRWLRRARPAQPKDARVAVLADPVYAADDPRLSSSGKANPDALPRLRHSRDEAEAIARLLPPAQRWQRLDFAASRQTVLETDWSNTRIVHFATHARLDSAQPSRSGIALSAFDVQGQPVDDVLGVGEIGALHMPVDLVVLSACESAFGQDVAGEGVNSLARAFFHAGSRRVLASLWTVDDRAAAVFMGHFYAGLLGRGLDPGSSLRAAQAAMKDDSRWAAPWYWAGYVLQGEPREPDG